MEVKETFENKLNQLEFGRVKFANQDKGYGFITKEDGTDIFFHARQVFESCFCGLQKGDLVQFRIGKNIKGTCAKNVIAVKQE